MHEKKIKIYSFYYKPMQVLHANSSYVPVWAGKDKRPSVAEFAGDDSGKNISDKNKYYSELTGLYWVWKNTKSEIVGSCHYRRYFTVYKEPFLYQIKRLFYFPAGQWKKRYGLIYTQNIKYWKSKIISEREISNLLDKYQAILPIRRKLKYSIEEHYSRYHNIHDLKIIERIIKSEHPDYLNSYKMMLKGNRLFANNMFILNRDTFAKIMEWLFSILFKFEEEINLKDYLGYQERIFGFLSERLITAWIFHNNIDYKELPLIYFKKLKPELNA